MSHPVLIAGGGPVGLLLAVELGRAGIPAVVLERRPEHYEDLHVGTFHSRLVEIFTERGLMDGLGEPPRWPALHFGMIWLDLRNLDTEYNLLVSQTQVERLLEEAAVRLGADIRRGHVVTGLTQDGTGVTVEVLAGTGRYELRGDYLVGCDGVDSAVRALAGIQVARTGRSWYGIIGDFGRYDGHFEAGVAPGGVFGAMPDGTGNWRLQTIEFDLDGPPESEPATVEELTDNIKRVTGESRTVGEPMFIRRFGGITHLAGRYREGRLFLAGEAAHHYIPTASHGLNTGLADAVNLGWKLAAAVRGWAPPGLLDSYDAERRPAGYRACQGAQAQMALMHPLDNVAALREVWQELIGIEEVNRRLVGWATDIRYPVAGQQDGPLVGRRLAHLPLQTAAGPTSTAALLATGRGFLLDLSGGGELPDLSGWASRVDVVSAEPTPALDVPALLVRPDGYVVWTGTDRAGLAASLGTWFGEPSAG
jgi:2-polyprenyl-6-methoxyphenol hydroxylase-like FAD-dependent oxidoreductase